MEINTWYNTNFGVKHFWTNNTKIGKPSTWINLGNSTRETKHAQKKTCTDAEQMIKSVDEMAIQIATAIKSPNKSNNVSMSSVPVGISPG